MAGCEFDPQISYDLGDCFVEFSVADLDVPPCSFLGVIVTQANTEARHKPEEYEHIARDLALERQLVFEDAFEYLDANPSLAKVLSQLREISKAIIALGDKPAMRTTLQAQLEQLSGSLSTYEQYLSYVDSLFEESNSHRLASPAHKKNGHSFRAAQQRT